MRFLLVIVPDDAVVDLSPEIGEFVEPLPEFLPEQTSRLLAATVDVERLERFAVVEILPPDVRAFTTTKGNVQAAFSFTIEGAIE